MSWPNATAEIVQQMLTTPGKPCVIEGCEAKWWTFNQLSVHAKTHGMALVVKSDDDYWFETRVENDDRLHRGDGKFDGTTPTS